MDIDPDQKGESKLGSESITITHLVKENYQEALDGKESLRATLKVAAPSWTDNVQQDKERVLQALADENYNLWCDDGEDFTKFILLYHPRIVFETATIETYDSMTQRDIWKVKISFEGRK